MSTENTMIETVNPTTETYTSEYYTNKCYDMFKSMNVEGIYTHEGIKANIDAWLKAKEPLFNLLRKHPNWNEEAKAIVFLNEEVRMPNGNTFEREMYNLKNEISVNDGRRYYYNELRMNFLENRTITNSRGGHSTSDYEQLFYAMIRYGFTTKLSDAMTEQINLYSKHLGFTAKTGQKTSRVFNRVFKAMGLDTLPSYNKIFAKIADSLNPLHATKISVLSANFLDFMTMSNGNSWSSCHGIVSTADYRGCNRAGCAPYAMDDLSLIYYTIDKDYTGTDYCLQKKITRQIFLYKKNLLVQSRLYPKSHDNDNTSLDTSLAKQYRELVEHIIAICEDKPNLWENTSARIRLRDEDTCFMYPDWEHYYCCTVKFKNEPTPSTIYVGDVAYCLHCGKPKSYGGDDFYERSDAIATLYCYNCDGLKICDKCGSVINTHDDCYHQHNGHNYCTDCMIYCNAHERYELVEEIGEVMRIDEHYTVCHSGMLRAMADGSMYRCSECGDYHYSRGSYRVRSYDGRVICPSCYDRNFRYLRQCDNCGTIMHRDENGNYNCTSCHNPNSNN